MLSNSGFVDDMWVWAVDPDYAGPLSEGDRNEEYEGYLRVRVQQLVNNFFEIRRFHDEHPMKELWEVARKRKNQAFVSVKDEEIGQWKISRDIGSAMKPLRSRSESSEKHSRGNHSAFRPRGIVRLL